IQIDELALAEEGTVRLTAARTVDPDAAAGDGVLALLWTLPDGSSVRGSEIALPRPTSDSQVVLEAIDRHGARSVQRVAVAAGATARLIPNTKVPDTPENREIIDVCERYRHALEARDAITLMALASPHYWEDGGTPKPDDDYGYDGLRHVIDNRLRRLKSV